VVVGRVVRVVAQLQSDERWEARGQCACSFFPFGRACSPDLLECVCVCAWG
jgi:hypothetical protein